MIGVSSLDLLVENRFELCCEGQRECRFRIDFDALFEKLWFVIAETPILYSERDFGEPLGQLVYLVDALESASILRTTSANPTRSDSPNSKSSFDSQLQTYSSSEPLFHVKAFPQTNYYIHYYYYSIPILQPAYSRT